MPFSLLLPLLLLQTIQRNHGEEVRIHPAHDLSLERGSKICIEGYYSYPVLDMRICSEPLVSVKEHVQVEISDSRIRGMLIEVKGIDIDGEVVKSISLDRWQCRIEIIQPRLGAVYVEPEHLDLVYRVEGCQIPADGVVSFLYHKKDTLPSSIQSGVECDNVTTSCIGTVNLSNLEPGTHAISLSFVAQNGKTFSLKTGSNKMVIFDVLVESMDRDTPLVLNTKTPPPPDFQSYLDIVFVGTFHFDGQKAIWRDQLRAFQTANITASYVSFTSPSDKMEETFRQVLKRLNVFNARVPLEFESIDAGNLDTLVLQLAKYVHSLDSFTSIRGKCTADIPYRLSFLIPRFASKMIMQMVGSLTGYDVVVFANSRDVADVLLVRVAQFAGVRAVVMDLPNLAPHKDISVSAVVAPSHNTLQQPEIQRLQGRKLVISPGVDISLFKATRSFHISKEKIVVGFVGRLEPEKSVGLILHVAKALLSMAASETCLRYEFVVIGSGSLLRPMMRFSEILGVSKFVEFKGMLSVYDLPRAMNGIDILLNPSMRASETFCIVNVEAMAMGIPVVSFGAGGVSDYLVHKYNGIRVQEPRVETLVEVVVDLAQNLDSEWVKLLRKNAVQTAEKFSVESMVNKYTALYYSLA